MRAFLLIAASLLFACGDPSSDSAPKVCKKDEDCGAGKVCTQSPYSNRAPGVDMVCASKTKP